jgi:hypothetical protein
MAFHIPFNQRRKFRRSAPIYIGFDRPPRVKRKFNWWGFNGLMLSMASFATAGFASPVALLVSLVGLRKSKGPRIAAAVGTVFSMIGIALASTIALVSITEHNHHQTRRAERAYKIQLAEDLDVLTLTMVEAKSELIDYRKANGFLPDPIFGNVLTIKHNDPWGQSLRFEEGASCGIVRSAGPDTVFDTGDDVVTKVKGEVKEIEGPFSDEEVTETEAAGYSQH